MEDFEKAEMRGSESQLRQALENIGVTFKGRACRCPFHDDKHASAGIYFREGVWKFKCQTCKVNEDVIGILARAKGAKSGDILKENTNGHHHNGNGQAAKKPQVFPTIKAISESWRATSVFPYTDPKTKIADLVVMRRDRSDGKDIIQCKRVDGGFSYGSPMAPKSGNPIFNRTRVEMAETIFVVEGEKKVLILTKLGFVGTCAPMGAENYIKADWSPLNAKKLVILWPDHDAPDESGKRVGHECMKSVAEILMKLNEPPEIRWVDPEFFALPPKGDIEQYLEMYGGDDDEDRKRSIQTVIDVAQPLNGSEGLTQLLEDTMAGRRVVIPLPFAALNALSQALMPATVTCVCGDPGCAKSFLLVQCGLAWHKAGTRIAIFMLEEDKAYHLNRAIALLDGNGNLTDLGWIRSNPDDVRAAMATHKKILDTFSRCIYDAPDKAVTLPDLATWVEQRAAAGCKIIAIDPITAAATGERRFIEDADFMFRVKTTARKFGCRIILTSHPRNGAKGWLDMAGGAAFTRFSQTVLWIYPHHPPKKFDCTVFQGGSEYGTTQVEANRTIKLGKTRNGRGGGSLIAFDFDPNTLRFKEHGPVVKTRKEEPDE